MTIRDSLVIIVLFLQFGCSNFDPYSNLSEKSSPDGLTPGSPQIESDSLPNQFNVTILNYNIKGLPTIIDGNTKIDDIIDVLLDRVEDGTAPDVLLFEEVFTDGAKSQVNRLMGEFYQHRETGPSAGGKVYGSGLVALSRYPFIEDDAILFGSDCDEFDCFANKGIHYMKIELPEGAPPLQIYHTHMQAFRDNDATRIIQIDLFREIFDFYHDNESQTVFAGDFNFKPDRESYHVFEETFPEMINIGKHCLGDKDCSTNDASPEQDFLESTLDHQYIYDPSKTKKAASHKMLPLEVIRSFSNEFDDFEYSDHLAYEVNYQIRYAD